MPTSDVHSDSEAGVTQRAPLVDHHPGYAATSQPPPSTGNDVTGSRQRQPEVWQVVDVGADGTVSRPAGPGNAAEMEASTSKGPETALSADEEVTASQQPQLTDVRIVFLVQPIPIAYMYIITIIIERV